MYSDAYKYLVSKYIMSFIQDVSMSLIIWDHLQGRGLEGLRCRGLKNKLWLQPRYIGLLFHENMAPS